MSLQFLCRCGFHFFFLSLQGPGFAWALRSWVWENRWQPHWSSRVILPKTTTTLCSACTLHSSIPATWICWCILTYADVCWRMLTYADVCWRILTTATLRSTGNHNLDICNPATRCNGHTATPVWGMLTYATVCWRMLTDTEVCWRMLTYADGCWRILILKCAEVCWSVLQQHLPDVWCHSSRTCLTYADVCWRMLTDTGVCCRGGPPRPLMKSGTWWRCTEITSALKHKQRQRRSPYGNLGWYLKSHTRRRAVILWLITTFLLWARCVLYSMSDMIAWGMSQPTAVCQWYLQLDHNLHTLFCNKLLLSSILQIIRSLSYWLHFVKFKTVSTKAAAATYFSQPTLHLNNRS